jgi:hypothetical protein
VSFRLDVSLALGALLASCASSERGPSFATSSSFDDVRRRPPSFAPEATLPPAGEIHDPRGPAALPTQATPPVSKALELAVMPLDSEAARDVVTRFYIAVLLESASDLFALLAAQSWAVSEGNRQPAQTLWRARLAQLDYTSLSGRLVAAPQTLRTYTFQSAARARQEGVPIPAATGEVVVVARPALSWAGKTRLFGDVLAFRLRPKADQPGFEITEIVEDFRLP